LISFRDLDLSTVRVLLADADGNLFPSEEPAFEASTVVMNDFLASVGIAARFEADELRRTTTGKNFRTTALDLCRTYGVTCGRELENWVEREKREVSAHLGAVLRPDSDVLLAIQDLKATLVLAAVSSSASSRLDVCFAATGLDSLFPRRRRFSAEDSLPRPTSKPDPAIFTFAGRCLGVTGAEALAVEDSVVGAQSAVAAGFPTIGNVMFVAPDERANRIAALRDAGVHAVIDSWAELSHQPSWLREAHSGCGLV
jgi:beta-phosphoglucomutase-like phosphatase (HAD superfamily)